MSTIPAPVVHRRSGPLDLIATSTFGLEAVVARELARPRLRHPRFCNRGGSSFTAEPADICRTNLWLRTADRVLLRLDSFEATDFGQLFDRTRALPWAQWIPPDGEFPVSGRSIKSQLSSVPACQKIVKKAIVESLKAAYGVEWFAETGPKYSVEVALLENQATLTIDTSGPGLHKRGYRRLVGKAPLKETLAAALVLLSFWKPDRPLVDPFCGTGTIPIEAAMIGRNMAPGLQRTFAAEAWPALPAALWEAGPAGGAAGDAARPAPAHRRRRPGRRGLAVGPPPCPAGRRGRADPLPATRRSPSCTASAPTAASFAIRPTASGWAGPPKSRASIATCRRSSAG